RSLHRGDHGPGVGRRATAEDGAVRGALDPDRRPRPDREARSGVERVRGEIAGERRGAVDEGRRGDDRARMTRERGFDALFLAVGLAALSVTPKLLRPEASYAEGLRSPFEPLALVVIAQPIVLLAACLFAARSSRRFDTASPVRVPWTLLAL